MTVEEYKLASFSKLTQVVMGVVIMSLVDVVLAPERASTTATKHLLHALMKLDTWFQAMFINRHPTGKANAKRDDFRCRADIMDDRKTARAEVKTFPGKPQGVAVSQKLALAKMLGNEANFEPRYYRAPWPTAFFDSQVASCEALRHHLAVIEQVLMGIPTQNSYYSSFADLRESDVWKLMKEDIMNTFGQALQMTQTILQNETGKQKHLLANRIEDLDGADTIENMGKFFQLVNTQSGMRYPTDSEITTMEDDDICRLNVILMLFEEGVIHIADMMKSCLSRT